MIRPVYFYYEDFMPSYLSVKKHIPHAEHVDTGASSYAYWDAVEARWNGEADLLMIEHHIVIHDQVLPQLEACAGDWCTFPVGAQHHHLGCTRFSAALQRKVPMSEIRPRARRKCPHCGAPHFAFIDGPIWDSLSAAGIDKPCIHGPPVEHLPE